MFGPMIYPNQNFENICSTYCNEMYYIQVFCTCAWILSLLILLLSKRKTCLRKVVRYSTNRRSFRPLEIDFKLTFVAKLVESLFIKDINNKNKQNIKTIRVTLFIQYFTTFIHWIKGINYYLFVTSSFLITFYFSLQCCRHIYIYIYVYTDNCLLSVIIENRWPKYTNSL